MLYELTVPTVRDRVVQMATLLILEPIFEADFEDFIEPMGQPNGREPSWCATPTISWCWRASQAVA